MPAVNKLTIVKVRNLAVPGRYADGRGLYLQVSERRTKAWLFRFTRHGRAREMGLGRVSLQHHDGGVSLAEAREAAHHCHQLLRQGVDPIEARREKRLQARLERASAMTFEACARAYVKSHEPGWRSSKHAQQWRSSLDRYVFPELGGLPVAAIDTGLVAKVVEPLWQRAPETASRVRGRIEVVLDWAKARGHRDGENPARWRGHFDKMLPKRSKVRQVEHMAAMPYADVPAFMARLREQTGISARALEWTILTAARTAETLGATWDEIDLESRVWAIPPHRVKGQRLHRVPLSDRALEILKMLPREHGNPHVFMSARQGKPLGAVALLRVLRDMDVDCTVHGFRSSFRDWAAEQTSYAREIAEAALAHMLKDQTEAAYQRADLLERRRRLMADWAGYCGRPSVSGDVLPLQAAR